MLPTTRRSLIERIQRGGEEGRRALGVWFPAFRPAMRGYVADRFRSLAHQADEIVDDFIAKKVLQGPLLAAYRPRPNSRFRGYLRVALHRYCLSRIRRGIRAGRMLSFEEEIDAPVIEGVDGFDVRWARQVLGRAIRRMKAACGSDPSGRLRAVWGVFESRFLRPVRGKPETLYPELVRRYGFSSPAVAQKAATQGKRMLAEALTAAVAEYAGSDDAEVELADLWQAIKGIRNHPRGADGPPDRTSPTRSES